MDQVIKLNVFESCMEAPSPILFSDEHNLYMAYRLRAQQNQNPEQSNSTALVKFTGFNTYRFGSPNDETFESHPLYVNGLRPNGTYQVNHSSWMRELCARSAASHPHYCDLSFMKLNHYVWSFHDSTLEVIAKDYDFRHKEDALGAVLSSVIP